MDAFGRRYLSPPSTDVTVIDSQRAVAAVLGALNDADCRAILEATGEEPLTAKEVADACDLPLSTTYRKLDRLSDAELLEERSRICESGKHASEYVRAVADVVVSVGTPGEVELRLSEWPAVDRREADDDATDA